MCSGRFHEIGECDVPSRPCERAFPVREEVKRERVCNYVFKLCKEKDKERKKENEWRGKNCYMNNVDVKNIRIYML